LPVYSAIEDLGKGTLVRVLPHPRLQPLTVYALYPSRQYLAAKIKTWVEYLTDRLPGLLQRDEAALVELGLELGRPS
ncbi:LysR substrate-binding domain-containing protein, partial [Enterobacter roggenkampii]|uniref:LysR substrate-binding domain-containing protein n=1 Tax=Enterobacter roggenkampii TaxID=1812935 RepID=UPI000E2CBFF3